MTKRQLKNRLSIFQVIAATLLLVALIQLWKHLTVRAFYSPLPEHPAKVLEVEVVKTQVVDVLKIVDAIEVLESNAGKNTNPNALHNLCKRQGKANSWGYGGMAMKKCFDTHEEGRAWITYWWTRTLQKNGNNISLSACVYNLGIKTSNCPYASHLLALINKE